jgi:hypothetical protein
MENKPIKEESQLAKELQPFGSKWVALVKEKVVASGKTLKEVAQKAKEKGYTNYATFLVPPTNAIFIPLAA